MNPEVLFDLCCNFVDEDGKENYELKVASKKPIMLNRKQQGAVMRKSIQAFIHGVAMPLSKDRKIQAFTGSSDLVQLTKDVFNVTQAVPNFDLNWQQAFKGVPLKKGQLSWEICDVNSGQNFELIPEGGKIQFGSIEGTKEIVDIQKYGMGIGVTWETIEGRKLYKFWDQLTDTRAKLYGLWADVHYGLLATAATANQVSHQAGTTTLDKDIATLNKGAQDIGEANKDKGYGDTANARFLFYATPKLRTRINQALRVTTSESVNKDGQIVDAQIDPYYTYNSQIPANKGLLILPMNKIQNSVYLREKSFSKEQMESMNQLKAYWTAFGAAIGDNDQCYELAFA